MLYTIYFEQFTDEQKASLAEEMDVTIEELEERNIDENFTLDLDFEDLTDEQKEYIYENTENSNLIRCHDCGEIIEDDDATKIYDEEHNYLYSVCEDCLDDYEQCDDTEDYFRSEDMVTLNPGTRWERRVYLNSDAASEAYECMRCGDHFDEDVMHHDDYGNHICRDCYDYYDYRTCEECGRITEEEDWYYDNGDGCYYCCDCHRFNDSIDGYHHDNDQSVLVFRRMPDEPDNITEFLGVEVEVEAQDDTNSYELDERANDVKNVVPWNFMIKEDGSLTDGFEMVTDPCTLRFHLEKFPWEAITKTCIRNDMRSDQARHCGLHVHISRKALGATDDEQDMVIAKLIILFERFEPEIERFARRRSTQWAKFYKFESNKEDFNAIKNEMKSSLANKGGTGIGERYHAINITNTHTVEFRAFKGSLNVETIKATLEFVHEIVQFAKAASLVKVQNCVWTDIVHNTEYAELKSYLNRRGLYWSGCHGEEPEPEQD